MPFVEAEPPVLPGPRERLGLSGSHVVPLPADAGFREAMLHPLAAEAFAALRQDAARAGFDLRAVSAWRDFGRQLAIWNAKARGERPLLDAREQPIDPRGLAREELPAAILHWSALPGLSRHHWGTDLDVADASSLGPGRSPALVGAEYASGGPSGPMMDWLRGRVERDAAHGFFLPYPGGAGVGPEPWHISFAPLACRCEAALDVLALREALAESGLLLWDLVEPVLDTLVDRFARLPACAYPPAWRPVVAGERIA